jgi:putative transposase
MVARRTVRVKLDNYDEQLLDHTGEQFIEACNHVIEQAWSDNGNIETSKTALHEQTYDELREKLDLHSNHVQHARNKAVDALGNVLEDWSNGEKASKPQFRSTTIVYGSRTMTLYDDYVSLATIDGRIEADLVLPDGDDNPHSYYMENEDWERCQSELVRNSDGWFLHITFEQGEDIEETTEDDTVMGVDLGINQLAVTSTGKFWNGGELNHRRDEYERVRGNLQETGTRSAHLTIKQIGGTESNYNENYLHNISKELVEEAVENNCTVIVFEDLTGIREHMSNVRDFHVWAFNQLYEYVEYKARAEGIDVEQVEPQYTSKLCSYCGCEGNRDGERFECLECGREYHADYNASKNIAWRYILNHSSTNSSNNNISSNSSSNSSSLQCGQKSQTGGATSQLAQSNLQSNIPKLALKSGALDLQQLTDKPTALTVGR